jgi:hypothetical protein
MLITFTHHQTNSSDLKMEAIGCPLHDITSKKTVTLIIKKFHTAMYESLSLEQAMTSVQFFHLVQLGYCPHIYMPGSDLLFLDPQLSIV